MAEKEHKPISLLEMMIYTAIMGIISGVFFIIFTPKREIDSENDVKNLNRIIIMKKSFNYKNDVTYYNCVGSIYNCEEITEEKYNENKKIIAKKNTV